MLVEMGQTHLFHHWSQPGSDDDQDKKCFFDQVNKLDTSYPGGLGKNPFHGFTPSVPSGEILTFGDDNFVKFEEAGVKEVRNAAFVLVAGGLGEPILALQEASCRLAQGQCEAQIPLVIMTSDDTNGPTLDLLESNAYFGMKPNQVKLLKQEKVACLDDNDARLAVDPVNRYRIQTKPHGHGDVHSLLYSSGLLRTWKDAGLKWVLFFQDTNGLLFKAIPSALGVSSTKDYHVNSLAVPRKAKEAIGGITKLTHADGRTMVINVEYNQLDPLHRATGYSPFPGNINQLILNLGHYIEELTRTKGAIRFVNPKYKDSSKTSFKSSTRLESRVGFTVMDAWLAYAPVKNNPEDAAKVPKGNPYHRATSGEMFIYRANSLILKKAGVKVADPVTATFNGQQVEIWPRITWKPKWAMTFAEVRHKVNGNCSISQSSTMVINGRNVFLEDLSLDGALIVNAVEDAEVKVVGPVHNQGWVLEQVDPQRHLNS
ncbi:hypothetical protein MKW92_036539 [Papaver armeniacum]|nr:hypothetical protein MKW92_036539 [Papaver armeniacum]